MGNIINKLKLKLKYKYNYNYIKILPNGTFVHGIYSNLLTRHNACELLGLSKNEMCDRFRIPDADTGTEYCMWLSSSSLVDHTLEINEKLIIYRGSAVITKQMCKHPHAPVKIDTMFTHTQINDILDRFFIEKLIKNVQYCNIEIIKDIIMCNAITISEKIENDNNCVVSKVTASIVWAKLLKVAKTKMNEQHANNYREAHCRRLFIANFHYPDTVDANADKDTTTTTTTTTTDTTTTTTDTTTSTTTPIIQKQFDIQTITL